MMTKTRAEAQLGVLLTAAVLALALTGCKEGYSEGDKPQVSPFQMSNGDRLAALNGIAKRAHPDRRWIYSMEGICQLSVEYRRKGSRATHTTLKLMRSMDSDLAFDKLDRTYDVVLRATSDRDAEIVATVMESKAWTDASQAALYLTLLIRDCERPAS
jgi:hypothetical protein